MKGKCDAKECVVQRKFDDAVKMLCFGTWQ